MNQQHRDKLDLMVNVYGVTTSEIREALEAAIALYDRLQSRPSDENTLNACRDMLAGWVYIRHTHGDLPGVGWDRAQTKMERAIDRLTAYHLAHGPHDHKEATNEPTAP